MSIEIESLTKVNISQMFYSAQIDSVYYGYAN